MKNNLLILILFIVFIGTANAGAYDDILIAAQNDDTTVVIDLIKRGMDVNTTDRDGSSLLMIAARNGNQDLTAKLINQRANVNHRNRYGDSALALASLKGHLVVSQPAA